MLPLVLSSDSHVFEPPDLWQTRIAAAFRDRAPRIERIDESGVPARLTEAARFPSGLGVETAFAGRRPNWSSSPRAAHSAGLIFWLPVKKLDGS